MKNDNLTIGIIEIDQHSPLEIRERLNYHSTELEQIVTSLQSKSIFLEKLFLCTCNRSLLVFICSSNNLKEAKQQSAELFNQWAGMPIPREYLRYYTGRTALAKLVRLSVGIESAIFGENEILGQIKLFYEISRKNKLTGKILNKVIQRLQFVAKKIKHETPISQGRLSLPGLTVKEVDGFISNSTKKDISVLIIGWGNITYTIFKILSSVTAITKISVANRTLDKVNLSCEKIEIGKVKERLSDFDIVISMTSRLKYLINMSSYGSDFKKAVLLLDLGVPRNIDPNLSKLPFIKLVNIDNLNQKAAINIKERKRHATLVKTYISEFEDKMIKFITGHKKQQKTIEVIKETRAKLVNDIEPFLSMKDLRKRRQVINSFCKKVYRTISL